MLEGSNKTTQNLLGCKGPLRSLSPITNSRTLHGSFVCFPSFMMITTAAAQHSENVDKAITYFGVVPGNYKPVQILAFFFSYLRITSKDDKQQFNLGSF